MVGRQKRDREEKELTKRQEKEKKRRDGNEMR